MTIAGAPSSSAQRHDMNVHVVFFNDQSGPHDFQQLLLRNHPITAINQCQQQIEDPRPHARSLSVDDKLARTGIQADTPGIEGDRW